MLIKITHTCWLNPQDVSAITVNQISCLAPNDNSEIEILLRNGQSLKMLPHTTFSKAKSFTAELVEQINAEESYVGN